MRQASAQVGSRTPRSMQDPSSAVLSLSQGCRHPGPACMHACTCHTSPNGPFSQSKQSIALRAAPRASSWSSSCPHHIPRWFHCPANTLHCPITSVTSQVMASQKQMEAKFKQAQATSDDWLKRAELAVSKGEDELAREALKRRKAYQVRGPWCPGQPASASSTHRQSGFGAQGGLVPSAGSGDRRQPGSSTCRNSFVMATAGAFRITRSQQPSRLCLHTPCHPCVPVMCAHKAGVAWVRTLC